MASTISDVMGTFRELQNSIEEAASKATELEYDLETAEEEMDDLIRAAVEVVESADLEACSLGLVVVSAVALKELRDLLVDFNEIGPSLTPRAASMGNAEEAPAPPTA